MTYILLKVNFNIIINYDGYILIVYKHRLYLVMFSVGDY